LTNAAAAPPPQSAGAAEGRFATVAGALLLGGASQRMGRDKARIVVGGVAAATRLARLLDGLFEEVLLVGGEPPGDAPGRRVADPPGPRCALRGLVGALTTARAERVLIVATDLLALTEDLLLALLAFPEADAVVPRRDGRAQPLCALYRREAALAVAMPRLESGKLALHGVLDELDVAFLEGEELRGADPDGHALANVNSPQDLAALGIAGAR
jgi:molybdopterin-guanine dinucleotide biosynthesis protein A